jgi:hypothetical protein
MVVVVEERSREATWSITGNVFEQRDPPRRSEYYPGTAHSDQMA